MPINNNDILHNLEKMRLNKSVSLSVDEKAKILKSVFENQTGTTYKTVPVRSPFMSMFNRYAVYVLPAFILGFIGLQYGQDIIVRTQLAFEDFNNTRAEVKLTQVSAQLRNSLSKTTKDISSLKSIDASGNSAVEKAALVSEVSIGAKSIRNQVAALVRENKITEAKEIVLTLETALKADELYKLAPAVQSEVAAATDLRVILEKKETLATTEASSTASTSITLADRIKADKVELAELESNASTSDLLIDAKKYLHKAESYLEGKDPENAIISLQTYDRIVAEVKLILLK